MEIFILLLIFQLKHFLCDYPLQTQYMLGKFKPKGWILPLTLHASVHALFTFAISLVYFFFIGITPTTVCLIIVLPILDFIVHFTVDRLKAHPNIGGKYKPDNPKFWWCLGTDQSMHHITHYMIIYLIICFSV